jgi:hypothetical protein
MTRKQFARWSSFAIRMAKVCFAGNVEPTGADILANVEGFFDCLDADDFSCIVNWDHSKPYPKGSPHRRAIRTYRCGCGYRGEGYSEGHDKPKPDCKNCGGTGTATEWARPSCVGDMVSECSERWIPNYWSLPYADESHIDEEPRYDEHGVELYGPFLLQSYDEADDQYCGPVRCCLRAGLDCASAPSAGVMGFTAGDLRRMYPRGVPKWVKGDGPWNSIPIKGVIPGVGFVPGEPILNGTFDEIPDDAEIWI